MWPLLLLFYPLNAALVCFAVARGIYSPRLALGDAPRMAAVGVLAALDGCAILWIDSHAHLYAATAWALTFALAAIGVPSTRAAIVTTALGRWRFAVFGLSVAVVSGLAYVHLPITTYLTSPEEFGIDLLGLTTVQIRTGSAVVYVSMLLYALVVSPRMKSALTALALGAALTALLYAFVLPFGYPMMNGLTFERIPIPVSHLVLRGLADVSLVAAVAFATHLALVRLGGKRLAVGMVMVNVSLVLSTAVNTLGYEEREAPTDAALHRSEHPLRLSREKPNVLIILLDRFMGGFVEHILATDPGLEARLDGFTWYPRTLAAGQNSIAGAHAVFGGYDYTPREMNARGKRLLDVSVEAYRILPYNFSRAGYRVNFVNPKGLGFSMAGNCDYLADIEGVNCLHVDPAVRQRLAEQMGMPIMNQALAPSAYADLLTLLGAMRSLPYGLKEALYHTGSWQPLMDHSAGSTFREWAELKSLPTLTVTDSPESNLSILWNILPHEPYYLGEDCVPSRTRLEVTEEELKARNVASLFDLQHGVAARCSLALVADYFDYLKAEGVYDNTRIIIVSDHGIAGPVRDTSSRAVRGGTEDSIYVASRSVLLVKNEGARGKLTTSEAFMPNAEVPRIACEQIGGCVNPYRGDKTIAAHGRDDPFHVAFTPWRFNRQEPNAFVIEKEMTLVDRDPYDARGWRDAP